MKRLLLFGILILLLVVPVSASDTYIIYSSSDAMVYRDTPGTFAQITSGAGTAISTTSNSIILLLSGTTTFGQNDRYIIVFNTTPVQGKTIVSAKIRLRGASATKSADFGTTNFGAASTAFAITGTGNLVRLRFVRGTDTLNADVELLGLVVRHGYNLV